MGKGNRKLYEFLVDEVTKNAEQNALHFLIIASV